MGGFVHVLEVVVSETTGLFLSGWFVTCKAAHRGSALRRCSRQWSCPVRTRQVRRPSDTGRWFTFQSVVASVPRPRTGSRVSRQPLSDLDPSRRMRGRAIGLSLATYILPGESCQNIPPSAGFAGASLTLRVRASRPCLPWIEHIRRRFRP